ncbi:MAG TPA: acetolactate synthase small subunit [Fibrobacteres bacterium]|jgi:acetolactate synthase I/III small subunit|nr:acetolactate synthase small subunit [Fibrobacterota bacterium]
MSIRTISVLVENHSGTLSRISGLFSSRGYNINSLTVGETEDPSVSRMTIVVGGDDSIIEQVVKQLYRLIDVIKVIDFGDDPLIERELVLVRVDSAKSNRHEIIELTGIFGATVAHVGVSSMTLELSSTCDKVDNFINLIKPYGIKELIRTGKVAMAQPKK